MLKNTLADVAATLEMLLAAGTATGAEALTDAITCLRRGMRACRARRPGGHWMEWRNGLNWKVSHCGTPNFIKHEVGLFLAFICVYLCFFLRFLALHFSRGLVAFPSHLMEWMDGANRKGFRGGAPKSLPQKRCGERGR